MTDKYRFHRGELFYEAVVSAAFLRLHPEANWHDVNHGLIKRFGKSGLLRIKTKAWKLLENYEKDFGRW